MHRFLCEQYHRKCPTIHCHQRDSKIFQWNCSERFLSISLHMISLPLLTISTVVLSPSFDSCHSICQTTRIWASTSTDPTSLIFFLNIVLKLFLFISQKVDVSALSTGCCAKSKTISSLLSRQHYVSLSLSTYIEAHLNSWSIISILSITFTHYRSI